MITSLRKSVAAGNTYPFHLSPKQAPPNSAMAPTGEKLEKGVILPAAVMRSTPATMMNSSRTKKRGCRFLIDICCEFIDYSEKGYPAAMLKRYTPSSHKFPVFFVIGDIIALKKMLAFGEKRDIQHKRPAGCTLQQQFSMGCGNGG